MKYSRVFFVVSQSQGVDSERMPLAAEGDAPGINCIRHCNKVFQKNSSHLNFEKQKIADLHIVHMTIVETRYEVGASTPEKTT
jgi:hypothetical protein